MEGNEEEEGPWEEQVDLGRDEKGVLCRRRGRENQVQEFHESDCEEEDEQVES